MRKWRTPSSVSKDDFRVSTDFLVEGIQGSLLEGLTDEILQRHLRIATYGERADILMLINKLSELNEADLGLQPRGTRAGGSAATAEDQIAIEESSSTTVESNAIPVAPPSTRQRAQVPTGSLARQQDRLTSRRSLYQRGSTLRGNHRRRTPYERPSHQVRRASNGQRIQSPRACYVCGQNGHFASMCPTHR